MGQTDLRREEAKTLERRTPGTFLKAYKQRVQGFFARYRDSFRKRTRGTLVPLALVSLLAACSYQDQRIQDLLNNPATIKLQLKVGESYETDVIIKEFPDGSQYFYTLNVTHTEYDEYHNNSYPEVEVRGFFSGGTIARIRHSKLWTVNGPKYKLITFKDSLKDNNEVLRTLEFMVETYSPGANNPLTLYLRWDVQLY